MNRALLVIPAAVLVLLAITTASGQDEPPRPEFEDAPVTDVLKWAQSSIGCGFVYEGADLNDPDTGSIRRITAEHADPQTRAEKTLLLFELLKRTGLVAFEVGGMPGPTYQLYTAEAAARNAPLIYHPDELDGRYFAALAMNLESATVDALVPRIRPKLTEGIGHVEVFEETQTLIVTDYADRLEVAWEIMLAADMPLPRSDDVVVELFRVENGVADQFAAALERLRHDSEEWKITLNAASNVLLVSGRRDEVERVIERARKLDAHPEDPAFDEDTHTIKVIHIESREGMNTLKEMFAREIAAGSVQVGEFPRDRKVVFRGGQWDFERARATIRAIDVPTEEDE